MAVLVGSPYKRIDVNAKAAYSFLLLNLFQSVPLGRVHRKFAKPLLGLSVLIGKNGDDSAYIPGLFRGWSTIMDEKHLIYAFPSNEPVPFSREPHIFGWLKQCVAPRRKAQDDNRWIW